MGLRQALFLTFFGSALLVASPIAAAQDDPAAEAATTAAALSDLRVKTVKRGRGDRPAADAVALVNLRITPADNDDAAEAAQWAVLPIDQVPIGLSAALVKMQKGGRYRFTLLSALAFGAFPPHPDRPADTKLMFDVTMLDFLPSAAYAKSRAGEAGSEPLPRSALTASLLHAVNQSGVQQTASGLRYKILKPGTGPRPDATSTTLVAYEGRLLNGKLFDSSPEAALPVNRVVPGFGEALQLMQKGGHYRIWLPPELAYGERSPSPDIPANSWLSFDMRLIDFVSAEEMQALRAGEARP